MLGKLSLSAIPFDNPIIMGAFGFMIFCVLAVAALIMSLASKVKSLFPYP